jgi:hypothetical protein
MGPYTRVVYLVSTLGSTLTHLPWDWATVRQGRPSPCQSRLYLQSGTLDLASATYRVSQLLLELAIPNLSCKHSRLHWHQRRERLREREKRNAVTVVILV